MSQVMTADDKLAEAVDMLHTARQIAREHSVLFRQIRKALDGQHYSSDAKIIAEVGERDSDFWSGAFESLLVQLGEEVSV